MDKTLIVMRHAKAKRPSAGHPDFERPLSEAGRRSLKAALRTSLAAWTPLAGPIEIWASPAVRTMQTAELLAGALEKHHVKRVNIREETSLWNGDAGSLIEAIGSSEAPIIALVGHNPFVEQLVCELTGASIAFSTGAYAIVKISSGADSAPRGPIRTESAWLDDPEGQAKSAEAAEPAYPARLVLFAQGPESRRWKTLVTLEKTLYSSVNLVKQRREAFLENPEDIETMHALRVSIRTLRSLIAFVKPWQNATQNAKAQNDLRAIVSCTSRLRELDVLCEQAAQSEGSSPELVQFCAEQAARERAKVLEELAGKQTAKRLERVAKSLKPVRWSARCEEEGLDPAEVRAHFDDMTAKLRAELETLDLAETEQTHDVRKKAKRVRYAAEKFKEILGEDALGIAKDMVAHQDDLGAICDARVNVEIINGFATSDLPEPVAWELALLRAQYETFLYGTLRDKHAEPPLEDDGASS